MNKEIYQNDFIKEQIDLAMMSTRGVQLLVTREEGEAIIRKIRVADSDEVIADIVLSSPVLTLKVLSEARSKPIDIFDAVKEVGLKKIEKIIETDISVESEYQAYDPKIVTEFRVIGGYARFLAEKIGGVSPSVAQTAAVLSSLGIMVCSHKYQKEFSAFYYRYLIAPFATLIEETTYFGCSHSYVGASVARDYSLPAPYINSHILMGYKLINSIPDGQDKTLAGILQLSLALYSKKEYSTQVTTEIEATIKRICSIWNIVIENDFTEGLAHA